MAEESFQEKTEEPTSKKLEDARKKGNIPQSQEISSFSVLLISFFVLFITGDWFFSELSDMTIHFFEMVESIAREGIDITDTIALFNFSMRFIAIAVAPLIVSILASGIIVNVLQVGINFLSEPLKPKFDNLNPLNGIKNIISKKGLFELFKNVLKLTIIGYVAYIAIMQDVNKLLVSADLNVLQIFVLICRLSIKTVFFILLAYMVLAFLDLWYQRHDYKTKLKMSKQEIKEEHKMLQGDPEIKSRIRGIQIEMAKRRMMQEVPKATVVITNPTLIAVAIKYETGMKAPIVVAKGMRNTAEKIKELAKENSVPIVENKPLARTIYESVEVAEEIPPQHYEAIAEIIAYVYKLKGAV